MIVVPKGFNLELYVGVTSIRKFSNFGMNTILVKSAKVLRLGFDPLNTV